MERNISMGRALARFAWLLLLAAATAQADTPRSYTVHELPSLGLGGFARTINDRGDMAGSVILQGPPNVKQHAALWSHGKLIDLGAGLGDISLISAMNDEGTMIGQVGVQPFMWSRDGRATALPFAGFVGAINHDGTIAGSFFPSGVFNFRAQHAMFFKDGVVHDLGLGPNGRMSAAGGINDDGVVVGSFVPNFTSDNHAAMWKDGVVRDLGGLGGHNSFAGFVNNRGDIVGTAETADQRVMMVRWHVEGGMEVLGESLSPHAMNERGVIVGNALRNGAPFVWQDGTLTFLFDVSDLRAQGWTSFGPFAINERGQIAGIGFRPGTSTLGTALVLTPKE